MENRASRQNNIYSKQLSFDYLSFKLTLQWDNEICDREILATLFFIYDYLKKIFTSNLITLTADSLNKTVPLDDIAIYKYTPITLTFPNGAPTGVKDDQLIKLQINSRKQLLRLETNGNIKEIASNINKTGYAKIAALVDMPVGSDLPASSLHDQADDVSNRSNTKAQQDLDTTQNPQSILTQDQKTPNPTLFNNVPNPQSASKHNAQSNYVLDEYSMDEVKRHNTDKDAWTVVNGRIYDITNFLYRHPGGYSQIAEAIGIDGSSVFRDGHGMTNSESFLKRFMIGKLRR